VVWTDDNYRIRKIVVVGSVWCVPSTMSVTSG
jgi:hypothetical protein